MKTVKVVTAVICDSVKYSLQGVCANLNLGHRAH